MMIALPTSTIPVTSAQTDMCDCCPEPYVVKKSSPAQQADSQNITFLVPGTYMRRTVKKGHIYQVYPTTAPTTASIRIRPSNNQVLGVIWFQRMDWATLASPAMLNFVQTRDLPYFEADYLSDMIIECALAAGSVQVISYEP